MKSQVIEEMQKEQLKQNIPSFRIGDTLAISLRIIEGEKERIQLFTGTLIARRGRGLSETIALYRVSHGVGVERVFTLHSPKIAKIEVMRTGKVRKSKLYYLRGTSGKASKVKELIGRAKPKERGLASPVTAEEPVVEEMVDTPSL